MRIHVLVFASAAALITLPATVGAVEVEVERPGAVVVPEGRSLSEGECKNLRQACLKKEELGEEGEGNCRRYRELCR